MSIAAVASSSSRKRERRGSGHVFASRSERRSIGFVSTYPPTKCGLATFTASLAQALEPTVSTGIVRCVDEPQPRPHPPGVVAEWIRESRGSLEAAARALNSFDSVVVQHEFGAFGGRDGAEILDLVGQLRVPVIVVLHTVLAAPSPHQRWIIEKLAAATASRRRAERRRA